MGLSGITTNIQQGGIGRRAPSNDKISALLWYSATYPTGFDVNNKIKKVFTLQEAEALGILSTTAAVEVLHYHVKEYFRLQPEGELWIGVFPVPAGAYDFAEITTMADFTAGEFRQIGVYANLLDFTAAQATTIQAIVVAQYTKGFRFSVGYQPNFPAAYNWTTTTDIRTLTADRVSVLVGQDGGGKGLALFTLKAFTIGTVGAWLGCISKAKVNQSIGNPANFNISGSGELDKLVMASGVALLADAALGTLKDKGYSVVRKYAPRLAGSFFERIPAACSATSDYAWIEFGRTIDKAVRGVEAILMPQLQAGIALQSSGKMRDDVVGYFKDLCENPLKDMQNAGEISNFLVLIDPNQNIQSTSRLTVTVKVQPTPIAEFITLNIGLTAAI